LGGAMTLAGIAGITISLPNRKGVRTA